MSDSVSNQAAIPMQSGNMKRKDKVSSNGLSTTSIVLCVILVLAFGFFLFEACTSDNENSFILNRNKFAKEILEGSEVGNEAQIIDRADAMTLVKNPFYTPNPTK